MKINSLSINEGLDLITRAENLAPCLAAHEFSDVGTQCPYAVREATLGCLHTHDGILLGAITQLEQAGILSVAEAQEMRNAIDSLIQTRIGLDYQAAVTNLYEGDPRQAQQEIGRRQSQIIQVKLGIAKRLQELL